MMRVGLVLTWIVAWPQPVSAEEIRVATLAPAGTPWMETLDRAAAEIAEKTENRVTVKYFPGGQMGDERDFVRKIKLGQIDGAAVTAMGLAMIEPSILVLQLPMLFATEDELDYVATKMWPYFQKKFEKHGFRLGERGEVGWIYFFSKNKVRTMADLRAQKLWKLADTDIGGDILDKLKLNAVQLGIAEVDTALTSGKINAVFSSPFRCDRHAVVPEGELHEQRAAGVRDRRHHLRARVAGSDLRRGSSGDRDSFQAKPKEGAHGDPQGQRGSETISAQEGDRRRRARQGDGRRAVRGRGRRAGRDDGQGVFPGGARHRGPPSRRVPGQEHEASEAVTRVRSQPRQRLKSLAITKVSRARGCG